MRSLILTILLGSSVFYGNKSFSQELDLVSHSLVAPTSPPTKDEIVHGILYPGKKQASFEFRLEKKKRVPGTGAFRAGLIIMSVGGAMVVTGLTLADRNHASITSPEALLYLMGLGTMIPGAALTVGGGAIALVHLNKNKTRVNKITY